MMGWVRIEVYGCHPANQIGQPIRVLIRADQWGRRLADRFNRIQSQRPKMARSIARVLTA